MGTWDALIKSVLTEVADPILRDGLEATVQHKAWLGTFDQYGQPNVNPVAVPRAAVVSDTDQVVNVERGGQIVTVVASYKVQFLSQVAVTSNDEIALPDGRKAPILKVDHGVLASDGSQLLTAVICG